MRGLDSPWGLRVTGLVGVAVVAAGAYGAGALPGRDPGLGLRGPGTPGAGFWWGLAAWVVGLAILSGAWWRLGSRLDGVSSRWVVTTGALWALPLLLAPPLASRDVYSYACQGEIWRSGLDPYSVGAADGGCLWSGAVPDLWQHTPAPYGPVGIALSGAAAAVARAVGGSGDHQLLVAVALLRVVALVGGVLIAVYAGRLANAVGVPPASARWLGLLSPLVAVHLVSGAHNDALMAGLIVAALAVAVPAVASRRRGDVVLATSARGANDAGTGTAVTWSNASVPEIGEHSPQASASRQGAATAAIRTGFAPEAETGIPAEAATGGKTAAIPDSRRVSWGSAVGAGAFLGLAVGVKVTAILALPFVILLVAGWRLRQGKPAWATIALAGLTVTGTGALVFAAASAAAGLDLGWVGALSDTGSLVQWTSLPTGIGMAAGYVFRAAGYPGAVDTAIAVARACGVVALAVIGLALCWRALRATLALRPTTTPAPPGGANTESAADSPPAQPDTADTERRREVVAACGWALAAAALLLPVFYPWYALVPLTVLACATPPGKTRTALATAAIAVTALTLPNGLGLPVLTKLPGAILDVAIVAALVYRFRSHRNNQDVPLPADGVR
ncbi:polyprenol phosphomannose-dependent alpha 1,6 mannosyltransferase MptB [Asanoa sp. NPDC049518]|uniref:polyprenol phosphomannose-dependent alpha 1,6 mannosyltransferase MptB n=1 Tax=unclassified Asanoa TaxID=2685164 RepID=UPI00342DD689